MSLQYKLNRQPNGEPYPRQRWLAQIEVQGNDEKEVIALLRNFLCEAEAGRTSWQVVGGGIIVSHDVDDSITPESHRAAVDEYLNNRAQPTTEEGD